MKTVFQCEICHEKSEDRQTVEACEALGQPDPTLFPPIGLLVGDVHGPGPKCEAPWSHKTGADGRCDAQCGLGFIWVIESLTTEGHSHRVGFGNFRGNGCGDTFDFGADRKYLGYDTHKMGLSKYREWRGFRSFLEWPEARPCPAFWRAVRALRVAGLTPTVVRGGKVVPFTDPHPHDHYSRFPIGAIVRLKAGVRGMADKVDDAVAEIRSYIYEDQGGLVLDSELGGLRYWNVDDVEVVP